MAKHSATFAAAGCMLILILDTKTALAGAQEGLSICFSTVIPTLFPFSVLATYLCSHLSGSISILRSLGRLCRMPTGTEGILLLSFLGGYPIGIQCVCEAYQSGALQKSDAQRMMGFCSNAGIAFIFGMSGRLFPSPWYSVWLLIICVSSAVITGMLLPGTKTMHYKPIRSNTLSFQKCIESSIRSMARICAWIILFRIILYFSTRWFLFCFSKELQSIYMGVLELTGGILSLQGFSPGVLFMLASAYLSFGGLCVLMQSSSIATSAGLQIKAYFPGKILQCSLSLLLSYLIQGILFKDCITFHISWVCILSGNAIFLCILLQKIKLDVEISPEVLYNTERKGGNGDAFSKKDSETVPILHTMRPAG